MALCINTPQLLCENLQQLGMTTPNTIKHLGLHLSKTISATVINTMAQIEPKAVKRRILATTPPTDILHRSTLVTTALIPVYNHVFMALPVEPQHTEPLFSEILRFLWTKQVDGRIKQKRRLVAKNRLAAGLEMGGLGIPHPDEIIQGFRQNLIQRIVKQSRNNPTSCLPRILAGLLTRANRPCLEEHIQTLGPKQWRITGNRIQVWNRMLGLAFLAVADLLATYETSREFWHAAAIAGHSNFSKVFPLSNGEKTILRDRQVFLVSQLLEVNDLTGRLTVDKNVILLTSLVNFPHLQHKLRLLIRSMRRAPVVDKFVTPITTATSLFLLDKNLSQIFKQQQRQKLHKLMQVPPSYATRQRDGIMLPQRATFINAYKVLHVSLLPSKTKETVFQILNRTIWTQNKAFKSGRATDAKCFRCDNIETMEHLLYCCEHYSAKVWDLTGKSLTLALSHHSGEYIPAVVLTPLEIIFNKPHPSILLHVPDATTRKVLILLFQEIKRDIIYRRSQLQEPRRREELHPRIQAHLVSVINKITSLLEYQGTVQFSDGLSFLKRLSRIVLQA
jgi:hypothetical protein